MNVFISGGCKNGKSSLAVNLSKKIRKQNAPLYYLATMIPVDIEDEARIIRHQQEREGCGFETVEVARDILTAVDKCDRHGVFLLDSVTALLANEMFTQDGKVKLDVYKKVAGDLIQLINQVDDIVIVSDFIYSDASIYDCITETYRNGLAYIDRQMAAACNVVIEACVGLNIIHKGKIHKGKIHKIHKGKIDFAI